METVELQQPIDALSERQRPVATTGLEHGSSDRPLIGKYAVDLQLNQRYINGSIRPLNIAGPDGIERRELVDVRNELATPTKMKLFDFIMDNLHVDIDPNVLHGRLDSAQVNLYAHDSTYKKANAPEDTTHGFYVPYERIAAVKVNGLNINSRQYGALVHELTHAASVQVIVNYPDDERRSTVVGLARSNFNAKKSSAEEIEGYKKKHRRFGWLNEAVTEYITQQFLLKNGMMPQDIYLGEQMLLEDIIDVSGISIKAFLEAYFEEPDLNAAPGQRMPKWHKLQAELRQAFGPYFLLRVDDIINNHDGNCLPLIRKDSRSLSRLDYWHQQWQKRNTTKIGRLARRIKPAIARAA